MVIAKFDRLESIFRMVTPSTFVGGSTNESTSTIVSQLMGILFETPGGGVYDHDRLIEEVKNLSIGASEEASRELRRVVSVIGAASTFKTKDGSTTWPYLAYDGAQQRVVEVKSSKELFGASVDDHGDLDDKPYSVITINSPMASPPRRDAERAELFLNSVPSIVMSRCVPYLELEFNFVRPGDGTSRTQLQTMGLLRFLMGADGAQQPAGSANQAMIDARRSFDSARSLERSSAGMELFTAPQALTNVDPSMRANRYVDPLDPFRPFMSLMSVTIDVKPTVGVYSFKKASVQLKLHDRSRMVELADLIRPTVYTQSTIWLTYGWRHPPELDNPYTEFINNNMLRREAYGIYNSDFAFDQSGGVDVTLELYTKAASEVRTTKISQNLKQHSVKLARLRELADEINKYREVLRLDSPRPGGVEIRGAMLLDAAGRGERPEFAVGEKKDEVLGIIRSLESNLRKGAFDPQTVQNLVTTLKDMYVGSKQRISAYAEVERGLRAAVAAQFDEARSGLDPYLMFPAKDQVRASETGSSAQHPFVAVLKDQAIPRASGRRARRKFASFAKVFSVFVANSIMSIEGIDEVQAVFYQMNAGAGIAAGTNIAEFPIDMDVFEDAYREEVERKASDSFTIEEFLQLMIRSQVDDMRSIAYGFATYFEPYSSSKVAQLKRGQERVYQAELDNVAGRYGPFTKPQVEVFMETVFSRSGELTGSLDLLRGFNAAGSEGTVGRAAPSSGDRYKRILRIHINDRALNPYEAATRVLADKKGSFVSVREDWLKENVINDAQFLESIRSNGVSLQSMVSNSEAGNSGADGKFSAVEVLKPPGTSFSNKRIKELVSRSIPTIVYGTNASTVISAELASKRDPLLVASQLTGLNKNKSNVLEPGSSQLGGLPLRVLPGQLSMKTLGCPLLNYGQSWYCDFNTGTSIDNVYLITGLTHTLTPGSFVSQVQWSFFDCYGRYENANVALEEIAALVKPPSS